LARSNGGDGVRYDKLSTPWDDPLSLFSFAGAWAPGAAGLVAGWGAWDGERLSGALLGERAGTAVMLHGPVVVTPPGSPPEAAVEVAGRLVADALEQAQADGIDTVYTRPRGSTASGALRLHPGSRGRAAEDLRKPGVGLFGWRGGTALWSAAGRGPTRRRSVRPARTMKGPSASLAPSTATPRTRGLSTDEFSSPGPDAAHSYARTPRVRPPGAASQLDPSHRSSRFIRQAPRSVAVREHQWPSRVGPAR
jgi:hypothetical protein